ncbi:hypothetical protein HDF17_002912 [Granulicella arctica]|uniref:Uncharacterized protein n=1 Tax=Granulicella arctica TaxID=940613 RepID=A0A7Y9TLX8_9BACT|nr:hypothetical protein [Granulicella arctica]
MTDQHKIEEPSKACYTKPTLIEYGSFAEHSKAIGFLDPDELNPDFLTPSITSIAF